MGETQDNRAGLDDWSGPDDWAGPRIPERGSMTGRGPMTGGSRYMFGMWYVGELTKLCAYDFQVLLFRKRRAWDDCIAHTTFFPHIT